MLTSIPLLAAAAAAAIQGVNAADADSWRSRSIYQYVLRFD
jgi:hypothetical protein